MAASIKKKFDRHCKTPLCIRYLKELPNGYWQFELHWSTSSGIIRTVGWLWKPLLNRIDAPKCKGFPIMGLSDFSRAAVRRLFTDIMLGDNQIVVPPIKQKLPKREKHAKDKNGKQIRNKFADHPRIEVGGEATLAETHPEWGDLS